MKRKATATKKATKVKGLTIQQRCDRNNAAYEKATPAQRRVMIAKDAIDQIEKEKITPARGTYVHLFPTEPVLRDEALQPVLLDDKRTGGCNCCAKGALFISCVRLSNRFNGSPTGVGSSYINQLVQWPDNNYRDIERAFEGFYADSYDAGYRTINKWVKAWHNKYEDESDRLVAILRNIVKNKGTFKPKDV